MHVLLTGMNGTVAPVVAKTLRHHGHSVTAYDRSEISTEDESVIRTFLKESNADLLMHFALGSNDWTRKLARLSRELAIKYVYISSVSVFSTDQPAPFTKTMTPHPDDDYGIYKHEGEIISQTMNEDTYIARLSWQIAHDIHSNNMVAQLHAQMSEKGFIEASEAFYPSAAFIEDTAEALMQMLEHSPGIYHLNANKSLSFHDIALELATHYPSFKVVKTQKPAIDVRMSDDTITMPALKDALND